MKSCVIGGGSWGIALASVLAKKGPVTLWARDPYVVDGINETHRNPRYQTEIELSPIIRASHSLKDSIDGAELICVVVPSHAMRTVMAEAAPFFEPGVPIVSASKGIENESLMTMEAVLCDVLPSSTRGDLAFLSGPSFARETLLEMATAVTVAARTTEVADMVQQAFSTPFFRVYTTDDVVGVEFGGALKNVIAIAAGIVAGMGLGHNTRAALLTRGLAEISRLAMHHGANPLTLGGLSGMGDLVLTCTGDLSRNRAVGYRLGQGESLHQILSEMKEVAEGVKTTKSAYDLARREDVEMPITTEVYRILYDGKPAQTALMELMSRQLKRERT